MTREDLIRGFDPNGMGIAGKLFGLPFTPETSEMVILPLPWEVTVSYHTGAAQGPGAVISASQQIDLLVKDIPDAWQLGVAELPLPADLEEESDKLRHLSTEHLIRLENGEPLYAQDPLLQKINSSCENLNIYVKTITENWLREDKLVGVLGGDHSTPLGFMRALGEIHNRFGILQIDAHADLRKAYQGFTYSHASIMYNALKIPAVNRLVQVGIRDFCEEELSTMKQSTGRIVTFFDDDLKQQQWLGKTWDSICDVIIQELPALVYVSFDIDGLDPKLCPGTGTPVPGGLEFQQATYLLKKLVKSGRKIIGFDLTEVAPTPGSDWDANVGARMLYTLCNFAAVSQGRLRAFW